MNWHNTPPSQLSQLSLSLIYPLQKALYIALWLAVQYSVSLFAFLHGCKVFDPQLGGAFSKFVPGLSDFSILQ